MARRCLEPGCQQLAERDPRCPTHQKAYRRRLYGGSWERYSKARRAAGEPCSVCGTYDDLTVDHSTGTVMCRTHNSSRRWNA